MNNPPPPAPLGATPPGSKYWNELKESREMLESALGLTPRTDAVAIRGASTAFPRASYFVDSDFARTLERENATLLAETKRLREALEKAGKYVNYYPPNIAIGLIATVLDSALSFPHGEQRK